jgi:hypothetical protein
MGGIPPPKNWLRIAQRVQSGLLPSAV